MKTKKAKLFICHHPGDSLLYKNLIKIIKKYDKDVQIILFKVNHPYFSKFNFQPYKQYFDKIVEFDFIHYEKNLLISFWKIFSFQKKLKKITANLLRDFEKIDLFLDKSAWLPINILLYNLSRQKNIKNITAFSFGEVGCSQTKKDNLKTFLCNLCSLFFKCYKIKVISTLTGKFYDFVYDDNVAGNNIEIVSPVGRPQNKSDLEKENILPYPIIKKFQKGTKKDMIIIFGDANILQCYSEYLPEYKTFVKKITTLFKALENKYSNYKLYYKPHPSDKDRIMPGIDFKKYNLFDNTVNAQTLVDMYQERIRAAYTFSSTSVIQSSFFGIPSYTFYRYLFNSPGIKMLNNIFNQDNIKSKFLFHLSDLNEIGKIDNLKPVNCYINLEKVDKKYREILNV